MSQHHLHIPVGINFDCTGCGNCCFEWPVPATDQDVARISALTNTDAKTISQPIFRKLGQQPSKNLSFTHALEKRPDGRCQYLDLENRCQLHAQFGKDSKPSMCQLFPYTFTLTPSGAYASLSFASTGVLFNKGRALVEQREFLEEQLNLFESLFTSAPDWSTLQLVDGKPLSWEQYLGLEANLLAPLSGVEATSTLNRRLLVVNRYLSTQLNGTVDLDNAHLTRVRPILVDQILLTLLHEMYLPADAFAHPQSEFDTAKFMRYLAEQPTNLGLSINGQMISFKQLNDFRLGSLSAEDDDLLRRFLYCRIFSKLYFGPGFGSLSLLAGFNHLCVLHALLRLHLKAHMIASSNQLSPFFFAEAVRLLERRLTVVSLSREAHAIFEVLLHSPTRVERIGSLSN